MQTEILITIIEDNNWGAPIKSAHNAGSTEHWIINSRMLKQVAIKIHSRINKEIAPTPLSPH